MTIGRRDIRQKYGIPGNGCGDCMVVAFCPCCALVQEEKEVCIREEAIERDRLREQYERQETGMMYMPGGTWMPGI